jgi:hypothetical protein
MPPAVPAAATAARQPAQTTTRGAAWTDFECLCLVKALDHVEYCQLASRQSDKEGSRKKTEGMSKWSWIFGEESKQGEAEIFL